MPVMSNLVNNANATVSPPDSGKGVVTTPLPESDGKGVAAIIQQYDAIAIPADYFAGLPAITDVGSLPDVPESGGGPYVGFASDQSQSWDNMKAMGLTNGDAYIALDGQLVKLSPFGFHQVTSAEYFTRRNVTGDFTHARSQRPDDAELTGDSKFSEHYLSLLIVDVNGKLVPAKCEFIGTKSGPGRSAIRAVKQAASTEWAGLSEAHKVSAAFPLPFGRVFINVRMSPQVVKGGKAAGKRYFAASGSASPSTITQMQKLSVALNDVAFTELFQSAREGFLNRQQMLNELVAKTGSFT